MCEVVSKKKHESSKSVMILDFIECRLFIVVVGYIYK
ncbi:Uncharacterised protein [Chlamydia trachomatis]|nr:Uncharacterised protein [Chlamydia trachomatis]